MRLSTDSGTNDLVVDGNGSETIAVPGLGAVTTYTIYDQNEYIEIISNGSNWVTRSIGLVTPFAFAYKNTGDTARADGELVFDAEYYDNLSSFSTSTGRFTAPAAGQYEIIAGVQFGSSGSPNNDSITMRVGGSTINTCQASALSGSPTITEARCSAQRFLTEGEYLSVFVNGDASFDISGSAASWVSVKRIGL